MKRFNTSVGQLSWSRPRNQYLFIFTRILDLTGWQTWSIYRTIYLHFAMLETSCTIIWNIRPWPPITGSESKSKKGSCNFLELSRIYWRRRRFSPISFLFHQKGNEGWRTVNIKLPLDWTFPHFLPSPLVVFLLFSVMEHCIGVST